MYYQALLARYKECTDENGDHIWRLAREVLDGFRDYMFEHYSRDDLLDRANRLGYVGTVAEKMEQLAELDHDNLAINGEVAEKTTAKDDYTEEAIENRAFETEHYYIINPFVYG